MSFSNPIWLWGFMGLVIPVAIHFLSRKESKVIRLGSLRHLQDSVTNQSVNIRLNELLLLLLRGLLIITTVLLLAGLRFNNNDASSRKWLLIEPGVDQAQFSIAIDSLKKQGFITKQFVAGFPDTGESQKDSSVNYWALTGQIETHVGQAVVIAKNRLEGFKGKRIPLPQNVTWLSSDADSSKFNLTIYNNKADSVIIRQASSNAYLTSFNNESRQTSGESDHASLAGQVSVIVAGDNKYNYDKDIVIAALRAIDKNSVISIDIKSIPVNEYNPADSADWIVWLADEKIPAGKANAILIDTTAKTDNMPLLLKGDCTKRPCWKIVRRLNIPTALHDKLVLELSSILFGNAKKALRAGGAVNDNRTLPEQWVWSATSKAEDITSVDQNMNSEIAIPLVIIMMLLLTGERWLALKRNQ